MTECPSSHLGLPRYQQPGGAPGIEPGPLVRESSYLTARELTNDMSYKMIIWVQLFNLAARKVLTMHN